MSSTRYTPGYRVAVPLFLMMRSLSVSGRLKSAESVTLSTRRDKAVKFGNREHVASLRARATRTEFAPHYGGADPRRRLEAEIRRCVARSEQRRVWNRGRH